MRRLFVMVACTLASASLNSAVADQSSRSILPDLSFHFVCREERRDETERRIEVYLAAKEFKVLNQADIQHRYDIHLFDTNMVALDRNQRMVEIRSVPGAHARYSFYLYSRPPTNHLVSLENDILRFISENLRCENRQIARNENALEAREFYDSEIQTLESLFDEADRFNGMPRI